MTQTTQELPRGRQTPWYPEPDFPQSSTQQKAAGAGADGLYQVEPEAIFPPQEYFVCDLISSLSGIDLAIVQQAAVAKEISCVVGTSRGGQKQWKGDAICNWIRRRGLVCKVDQSVVLQHQANARAQAQADERERHRAQQAEQEKQRRVALYRETAARCPQLVDVLQVLAEMESAGHRPADVLRAIDATSTTT
jgi:hypothetical protein